MPDRWTNSGRYAVAPSLLLLLLLLMGVLTVPVATAQTIFGSITGTVTDASGAVIAGADVRVSNEGTGVERHAVTSGTGVYNVPSLNPGVYRVRIELKGFSTYERAGLQLNANQVINVDAQLAVAPTGTQVQVVETPPVVDTQTGTLVNLKTELELRELPLVSRRSGDQRTQSYVLLNPGVTWSRGGWVSGNGMRFLDSVPTVDGMVVMAQVSGGGGSVVQSGMEATQEVSVQLANPGAEFARPVQYSTITKAGTNEFHGGVFYDYNGHAVNARDFFAASVPFRVYNNFGGRIGGPMVKNRTFFFGAYEGSRDQGSVVVANNVPLPPWRRGNFSGISRAVLNPSTGQPFSGNIIPENLISPVSQRLQDTFYPVPNFGPPDLQSGNWRGALKPGLVAFTDFDSFDIRVDHKFRPQDTIFASFNYIRMPRTTWQAGSLPPFGLRRQLRQGRSGALSWMHILSPALVNEVRMGVTRQRNDIRSTFVGSEILQQAGIQGISITGVPVVPVFNVTGITTAANVPNFVFPDTSFQWTDNLNWTKGSHSLKLGFNTVRDRDSGFFIGGNVYGVYNFTGAFTGFPYADFLLGLPQTTQRVIPDPQRHRFGNWWAAYAQDQFKVTPRLTLNYGVRWEGHAPYYDNRGLLASFDPKTGSFVVPDNGIKFINPLFPKSIPVATASQAGYPTGTLLDFHKAYFYPRLGFAYRPFPNDRTVVRGGYGIYGSTIYPAMTLSGGPFSGSETFTNRLVSGAPLFNFPRPFLEVGVAPTQNAGGVNPRLRVPYAQQWNFTLERQVGEVGISIAYVGTRSVNLIYGRNLNQPPPSTVPFTPSRFTYALYNAVTWYENGGNQSYDSLQVVGRKTYGKNLFFNTGWTWAKSLTDTQDQTSFAGPVIQNAFDRRAERADSTLTSTHRLYVNVIYALPVGNRQRYLSHLSRPVDALLGGWRMAWNVLAQSGQFFTPVFSGSDPSNTNNFGGRPDRVAGLSTVASGGRTIQQWFNPAAFRVPGCPDSDPICRTPANLGRFGNSALNVLRAPRVVNFDLALMKEFTIRETRKLQLRVSATNLFNHPNFSAPATNISSPGTVGRITSTYGELPGTRAREVDFVLRVEF